MSNDNPTAVAKRKQVVLAIGVLAGILALASVGVYLSSDDGPAAGTTRQADIKTKSYIAPGEKIDPQDAWRGVSDSRLSKLEARIGELDTQNRVLKKQLEERGGPKASSSTPAGTSPEAMADDELDRRLKEYEKKAAKDYPKDPPDALKGKPVDPQRGPIDRSKQGTPVDPRQAAAPEVGGIETLRLRPSASAAPALAGKPGQASPTPTSGSQDPKNIPKTTQNYFPSGMFGRAVVLSGLDAPTGGQAQSNPHPVLLQLQDLAVLPNAYRYDWKQCMVTASGYGDISSERAYIRTESLSCVAKDGRVLDVPLKGYVAGEDGKAGMRGRLVSKQGQALANALLAGVVSGIGQGLEKSSQTTSVSPLGSTSTTKPGAEYQAGIGAGVGRGLERLSNYYIQLAEKMFPVIEVDAGRVVDVILTKGALVDVDVQQQ